MKKKLIRKSTFYFIIETFSTIKPLYFTIEKYILKHLIQTNISFKKLINEFKKRQLGKYLSKANYSKISYLSQSTASIKPDK